MSKAFNFHVPVELTKSEEDGEWRVRGIASTPDQDLQGEIVDQNGLDISPLKAGSGLFNWDHQKGPENILGQIEKADFVDVDGKKALMVDGYLFKNQDRSKAFYNIMSSMKKGASPRVHMSIEGKILDRDRFNSKTIKRARIDKVALTLDPVNPYTYAELVKSLTAPEAEEPEVQEQQEETFTMTKSELTQVVKSALEKAGLHFEEGQFQEASKPELLEDADLNRSIKLADHSEMSKKMQEQMKDLQDTITKAQDALKALMAGAGGADAPEARTGGAALTAESLDKKPKKMEDDKKKKSNMVKSVITSLKKAHPDEDPLLLAEWAIEMFLDKLDLGNNKGESRD